RVGHPRRHAILRRRPPDAHRTTPQPRTRPQKASLDTHEEVTNPVKDQPNTIRQPSTKVRHGLHVLAGYEARQSSRWPCECTYASSSGAGSPSRKMTSPSSLHSVPLSPCRTPSLGMRSTTPWASALIHATGRVTDARARTSRKPVRCSGEKYATTQLV